VENQLARVRFTSLRNDILARLSVAIEGDGLAGTASALNHDHGVGAGWDGGAGHDLDAGAGVQSSEDGVARLDFADAAQG